MIGVASCERSALTRTAATRRMPLLLSRYAEALFWLARYMERVENLARIWM